VTRLIEIIFYTWKCFFHRWKHTPVLLIWDGPVSDQALRDIFDFEDVYILRLPPLLNSSLIAGMCLCMCVINVNTHTHTHMHTHTHTHTCYQRQHTHTHTCTHTCTHTHTLGTHTLAYMAQTHTHREGGRGGASGTAAVRGAIQP
jgi:hypothetical protein